jgi:hypothetical protein
MVVYKYKLDPLECDEHNVCSVEMPVHARVLSAGEQDGNIFVWALVMPAPETPNVRRRFLCAFTGQHINPKADGGAHVSTIQMRSGIVVHVFDQGESA